MVQRSALLPWCTCTTHRFRPLKVREIKCVFLCFKALNQSVTGLQIHKPTCKRDVLKCQYVILWWMWIQLLFADALIIQNMSYSCPFPCPSVMTTSLLRVALDCLYRLSVGLPQCRYLLTSVEPQMKCHSACNGSWSKCTHSVHDLICNSEEEMWDDIL